MHRRTGGETSQIDGRGQQLWSRQQTLSSGNLFSEGHHHFVFLKKTKAQKALMGWAPRLQACGKTRSPETPASLDCSGRVPYQDGADLQRPHVLPRIE